MKRNIPPQCVDEKLETWYEEITSCFDKKFQKANPTIVIRVPYTLTLFGDNITKLFPEKIVTNIVKDLIIFACPSENERINICFFDKFEEFHTTIAELPTLISTETHKTWNDYIFKGWYTSMINTKSKKQVGVNVVIAINAHNKNDIDTCISGFLGALIAGWYVNNSLPVTKNILYDMALLSLNQFPGFDWPFYSSYVFYKLFLKRNFFGYNIGNSYYQGDVDISGSNNKSIFVFDSLSSTPISAYSSAKYWNKRKIEVRLGLALILKRYRETISTEDLIKYSKNLTEFLKIFDSNIETVFKMLSIYLKEQPYKVNEIKTEWSIDLKLLLNDIENFEIALMGSDFFLYKRWLFIFSEYKTVTMLCYKQKTDTYINWIKAVNESGENLISNYKCYSDEMLSRTEDIKQKQGKVGVKAVSCGWSGELCVIGVNTDIQEIEKETLDKIDGINEDDKLNGNNLASCWMGEESSSYMYTSVFDGGWGLLDPQYEDFMLDYVKAKYPTYKAVEGGEGTDLNDKLKSDK